MESAFPELLRGFLSSLILLLQSSGCVMKPQFQLLSNPGRPNPFPSPWASSSLWQVFPCPLHGLPAVPSLGTKLEVSCNEH